MRRIFSVFAALFLLNPVLGWAEATAPDLDAGMAAYQSAKYDEAREAFQRLVVYSRWEGPALYNLGNVASRQGHLGEALGFYRRALTLAPRDGDLRFNLGLTLRQLKLSSYARGTGSLELFKGEILSYLTLNELLSLLALATATLGFSLLRFFRILRDHREDEGGASPSPPLILYCWALVFLVFSISTAIKIDDTTTTKGTVIIAKVDLRSGPGDTHASMQEVTEGTELVVLDEMNDWLQVKNPGGLSGWVNRNSLMITSGLGKSEGKSS